jgi:hypothetical protein
MNARWFTVLYTGLVSIWDWLPLPFHLQWHKGLTSLYRPKCSPVDNPSLNLVFSRLGSLLSFLFFFFWSVGAFVFGMV